jgi:multisubunit Na+/H+ antiporter MnhF subunit
VQRLLICPINKAEILVWNWYPLEAKLTFNHHVIFVVVVVLVVFKTEFLCVALAVLELRNLPAPASASQVLGLKACTTNAWLIMSFFKVRNHSVERSSIFKSI